MAKHYIHSTATQDMTYCIYAEGSQKHAEPTHRIIIKGMANVVNPRTLVTPKGVVTEVTDEQFEMLKKNPHFKRHVANHFIKVDDGNSEFNGNGLEKRDNSSQLQDYEYAKGLDSRVPESGMCQASCGERDTIVGAPGIGFRGEIG